jgi:hypothetical protein
MPSQSRALEASFEPSDKSAVPPGSEKIPALEDFDSFFEKLNNLDHVDWRSAHPANPEPKPFFRAAAKPAPISGGKADALAGLRSAVAQVKQSQRPGMAMAAGEAFPPAKRRGMPGAFRFAATAFVLFLVGMGIGWAALSLPGKSSGDTATTIAAPAPALATPGGTPDGLASDPKVALPSKDASSGRLAAIVPLTEVPSGDTAIAKPATRESAGTASAAKSGDGTAVDLAAAKITGGSEMPAPNGKTGESSLPSDEIAANSKTEDASAKNSGSLAPARKAGLKSKAAKTAPAAAAPAAATETQPVDVTTDPAPLAAGGPQYAVQVGACRSTRCVDNYRALVTPLLPANADTLRVIPVPADGSGMQRVRVAPLDKNEAQQLRTALIQADPRLSNAYVVVVHP